MKRAFLRRWRRAKNRFLFALASIAKDSDRGQLGKCNYCPLLLFCMEYYIVCKLRCNVII